MRNTVEMRFEYVYYAEVAHSTCSYELRLIDRQNCWNDNCSSSTSTEWKVINFPCWKKFSNNWVLREPVFEQHEHVFIRQFIRIEMCSTNSNIDPFISVHMSWFYDQWY